MRLPTATDRQAQQEDAREMHERIWKAYTHSVGAVFVESLSDSIAKDAFQMHSNLHRFWAIRGYKLRTKSLPNRSGFQIWIEPKTLGCFRETSDQATLGKGDLIAHPETPLIGERR